MNYTGPNRYLNYLRVTVYDSTGNNNGRLDPNESAQLTATLKNIGGADFTNLSTVIQSTDPYITITDNSAYFGVLRVDSTKENINDRYTVSISANCPLGHIAQFQLIATEGIFCDTFEFSITIGSYDFLVWNPDPTPSSGQTINTILTSLSYVGNYTTNLLNEQLDIYRSLFICCGIYSNNYRIPANGSEAVAITNYLNNGGRVYLEGGDVWYYDPLVGGHSFGPLFGLQGILDGTGDLGSVVGQTGTFTQNMNFTSYAGENNYIDHLAATSGFVILVDGNNSYNCGVAYNAGTYRTVGTSFELGGLIDAAFPSTKRILLDSIMHFFGIFATGVEEGNNLNLINNKLRIFPNPVRLGNKVRIQYATFANEKVNLKIYNTLGSCVKSIEIDRISEAKIQMLTWDGNDNQGLQVPTGVYFINLNTDSNKIIKRVVLVN